LKAPQKRGTAPSVRTDKQNREDSRDPTVSVAIISHNYGRFLAEAINGVLSQTLQPIEILIIDDASYDHTEHVAQHYSIYGVEYLRVENRSVWKNRILASEVLSGKWILTLDADNTIHPHYLSSAVSVGERDRKCGIIYPSIQCFGDSETYKDLSGKVSNISVANHIDASSVFRREALLQANLSNRHPLQEISAEDWVAARTVMEAGWSAHHNPVPLQYRIHNSNKHETRNVHVQKPTGYYNDAALYDEPVSIVIPLSGRKELWPVTRKWLDDQEWPRDRCQLILIDNSHCDEFSDMIRNWAATSDYLDIRYCRDDQGRKGLADEPRTNRPDHDRIVHRTVASIYDRAFRGVNTNYILTLEDDIKPPRDVIQTLFKSVTRDTAAVTAAYLHRDQDRWLAYKGTINSRQGVTEKDAGTEPITGCGFGCLLLRTHAMNQIKLATDGPTAFYDTNACLDLIDLGWQLTINWSAKCEHIANPL